MNFDLKDCLFIAVDVQNHFYAANQSLLRAAIALHDEVVSAGAPIWQLYMTHTTVEDRQAKLDRYTRPMLPIPPAHSYAKTTEAPLISSDFSCALVAAAPAAIVLFGCYFQWCLKKSALHCYESLRKTNRETSVYIVDDCSLGTSNRYTRSDRQRILGSDIRLIDRDDLQLGQPDITVAAPAPARPMSSALGRACAGNRAADARCS